MMSEPERYEVLVLGSGEGGKGSTVTGMEGAFAINSQTKNPDAAIKFLNWMMGTEPAQMIADSRRAALAMFPGKELAYDLIWRPRFQRLMRERFRIM